MNDNIDELISDRVYEIRICSKFKNLNRYKQ